MKTPQLHIDSGFGFSSTADEVATGVNLAGKVIVITGGHSGIGLETTRVLSEHGATVVVGARDVEKAKQTVATFKNVSVLQLDLSDPESVTRFSRDILNAYPYIDILINNAGVMALPKTRDSRGCEMQFATNHLGHFQLTGLLKGAFRRNGEARVITLSSAGHRFSPVIWDDINFKSQPYEKWKAYGQSKTANSLFAVELDRRLQPLGIRSFAVHPGRIAETNLMRYMDNEEFKAASQASPALMKTIAQGAATTVWAATNSQLKGKGGVYCADCEIAPLVDDVTKHPAGVLNYAIDSALAQKLWDISEKMLQAPRS